MREMLCISRDEFASQTHAFQGSSVKAPPFLSYASELASPALTILATENSNFRLINILWVCLISFDMLDFVQNPYLIWRRNSESSYELHFWDCFIKHLIFHEKVRCFFCIVMVNYMRL